MSDINIRKEMKYNTIVAMLSRYSDYFLQLFITAILSRILTPKDFGVVAVVSVFVVFFQLASDIGIGAAIIQDKHLDESDIKSAFNLTIIIAIIFSVVFFSSANVIASFYDRQEYETIVKILSISCLFNILSMIPMNILRKKKKFLHIGVIIGVSNLVSGVTAIAMAVKGYSFYSLVIKAVLYSVMVFFLTFIFSKAKLGFVWRKSFFKRIVKFSFYQFMFNLVNYFSRNTDNILIGKYIGEETLGYYEKSYKLMMLPLQTFTYIIGSILHPILTEFQDDKDKLYSNYIYVCRILSLVGFPLSIVLFYNASELILILFGSQWIYSISIFKVLSLSVGFQMVSSSAGAIYQAAGRTELLFLNGVITSSIIISAVIFGILKNNVMYIAYGILATTVISFYIGFYILIRIALKQRLKPFYINMLNPLLTSLIMAAVLFFVQNLLNFDEIVISILLKSFIAFIVYLIMLRITNELKFIKGVLHD